MKACKWRNSGIAKKRRLHLQLEQLESRQLLAADWTWFQSFDEVPRVALDDLNGASEVSNAIGPQDRIASEWIVQLADEAVAQVESLRSVDAFLDQGHNDFTVAAGLGQPGLVLVRALGLSKADVDSSLAQNPSVSSHGANELITGQDVTPDDTDFVRGAMPTLTTIELPAAWMETRGSLTTVVGVLDTGIDLAHQDLYLNVWFNQGEIPAGFLDDEGNKLQDIDADGLITFYDLNNAVRNLAEPFLVNESGFANGPNAEFVNDLNGNGYIDGLDILNDPLWADGRDTDGNSEVDDFFGVNFRGDGIRNNPNDGQGHGTHVSGTIGAIGGNGTGVTGVNWQTSLMALRILDDNNQGDTGAAIAAVNYATKMRQQLTFADDGRVTAGANVRVLNNSWGQPGGFEPALESSIQESAEEDILFVAASGNGNFLGQGVDNDRTPFFPASYDSPNVIAVAAGKLDGSLAAFSNFGDESVDLVAPGSQVRSTELNGAYGTRNGTSMATPHVSGTAALIWSALPGATVEEVREAIVSTTDPITSLTGKVVTGGRLNAANAITASVFAPSAVIVAKEDITVAGGTETEFTVEYFQRGGFDSSSFGDDDIVVDRQWGPAETISAALKPNSIDVNGDAVQVTYVVQAPGGTWDILDFGEYRISTQAGSVLANDNQAVQQRDVGSFNVRIEDPSVIYVDTEADVTGAGSLRDAIAMANAAGAARTIILDSGNYNLGIPHEADPSSPFPDASLFCGVPHNTTGWSNESTGDFDITGDVTIIGNQNDFTVIDGQSLDRVFKVHPSSSLELQRVTVSGGLSPADQGGGGILSFGNLTLIDSTVQGNLASGPTHGGGIAMWGGFLDVQRSWIDSNEAARGGGIFLCGSADGAISQSTVSNNREGGMDHVGGSNLEVDNSTFSGNEGGKGALAANTPFVLGAQVSLSVADFGDVSADGRFVVFESSLDILVPGDTNGSRDVFVLDRASNTIDRVNLANDGTQADLGAFYGAKPSISNDGRFVAFDSLASTLVPNDTNGSLGVGTGQDTFVFDRETREIKRVSVSNTGEQADYGFSFPVEGSRPAISGNGRFVAFLSNADNLVPNDTNFQTDVFVYDLQTDLIERVTVNNAGAEANDGGGNFERQQLDLAVHRVSISDDGRFVSFDSWADNLVPNDTNDARDIFVFDRDTDTIERISTNDAGEEADGPLFFQGSFAPSMSGDGRFITFHSDANNLVPGDTNDLTDVFVFDRTTDSVERVNVASDGAAATSGQSEFADISDDGQFITFQSAATNLVADDTNGQTDIFVRDRISGTTQRVNVSGDGTQANEDSFEPFISGDAQFVGYTTFADNLITDSLATSDIFFASRASGTIEFTTAMSESSIEATQATVVGTRRSSFAVEGFVNLKDSLLVNEVLNFGAAVGVESNIVQNSDEGSDLFTDLTRQGFAPPVHFPLRGNPVIDAGDAALAGTIDQRGTARLTPDIGAVEAVDAMVSGQVFVDSNENQLLDPREPLISGVALDLATSNSTRSTASGDFGEYDFGSVQTGQGRIQVRPPAGFSVSQAEIQLVPNNITSDGQTDDAVFSFDGRFIAFTSGATNLVPNDTNNSTDIFVLDRSNNAIERVNVANDGSQAIHSGFIASSGPSISANGRFVAFESSAENLVPDVGSFQGDVFVYDRETNTIEQVSEADDGTPGNFQSREASISGDGRFVAFTSDANNLVGGDLGSNRDVFVRDRQTDTVQLISRSTNGTQGNDDSGFPDVSTNGRFVTFTSTASNLVVDDNNGVQDVFVRDLIDDTTIRVNIGFDGSEADGSSSFRAVISGDGRFVAFSSQASNLVADDNNGTSDVFVFDTLTDSTERVSLASDGSEANDSSFIQSISDDGRFIAFNSDANNLVPGDTNGFEDMFVYDRETGQIAMVNVKQDGSQPSDFSPDPFPLGFVEGTISPNGQFIAFDSEAADLVANDTNGLLDTFLTTNPFFDPTTRTFELFPGDVANGIDFGLIADPGEITGRLFEDSAILNQVYDVGETLLPERLVFIDVNENGIFDRDEPSTTTDQDGVYQFTDLPAHRDYSIRAAITPGDEQVVPGADQGLAFNLFLEAGASVGELDFGFRPVSTTGQSSDSVIQGRVQSDTNGNGVQDASDAPVVGQVVYLDGGTLGVRDFDDPQTVTDAQGNYSFAGLASTLTPVRLALDNQVVQVAPLGNVLLGNDSQPLKFPLDERERRGGNPQSVVTADFNLDGFEDVAVVLAETNSLSIRLNDTLGGFTDEKFDFILSEFAADQGSLFAAPIAVVANQFDNDSRIDVAVVGNFTGNVFVLSNFDHNTASFLSTTLVPVGEEPLDIIAGQFGGDSALDLVVLNKGNAAVPGDETVQVLTNDGAGVFTAGAPVLTGGQEPVSLSTANFTGSTDLDVAVTHAFPIDTTTTVGGVTMLVGDGNGGLSGDGNYYPVQSSPFDSDVGDFNGDGRPDLAVVNFASNSISILIGQADGTLLVQDETLGTVNGSVNVATADIDNDGDLDVITTKLNQRQVSIFRNITQPGAAEAVFEPQENVGLGQFSFSEQVPFAIANLDNDTSGPDGNGTLDIVAVPQNSDTLFVLPNQLVQGSRRVSVSGASTDIADDIDFLIAPATLAPSFDLPALPTPIVEDATQQTVSITNIAKGRASSNPTLRFIATSSNPALVPEPTISFVDGDSIASLQYTPVANGNGQAVITVRAEDAGADGVFGGGDDGILERSFTVTVLPVNDAPTFVVPASTQVTEGASPTSIDNFVTGISPGGGGDESGQTLNPFVVTTDNSFFTTPPAINASGQLTFAIAPDATGSVTVNVSLSDNGGVENGGTQVASSFFVINIAPDSPESIILEGDGNTFVFTESGSQLDGVQLIDIRGTGDNTLMLDVARIRDLFQNGSITVISDAGDEVVFDEGWEFVEAVLSNGQLVRRFEQLGAAINLMGPDDFTNPISEFDVNASGDVSALDALVIINELAGRQFSDGGSSPEGGVRDPGSVDLSSFRFYDVTRDLRITALDALRVINQLARQPAASEQVEGELVAPVQERDGFAADSVGEESKSEVNGYTNKIASFETDERKDIGVQMATQESAAVAADKAPAPDLVDEILAEWAG